ncbi:MAG: xanthine dehydrogenase family protein molybdopterin-binding subunit [Pseudomonadota bacterium]
MRKWMSSAVTEPRVTRRRFLAATGFGAAGLVVGCAERSTTESTADAKTAAEPGVESTDLNAFIRIGNDDMVTVIVKHLDKGQGVTTGLPTIVAEELDADWSQMRTEFAPADAKRYANLLFGIQGTGGSTAIANSWMQLRTAAATARDLLLRAAAEQWQVPAGEVTIDAGRVQHAASGRESGFGALVSAAGQLTPIEKPTLKRPGDFKLIGTRQGRMDSDSKTDGSARFTIDITRPGMRYASVAHPPKFGATVAKVDDSAARAVEGVVDVAEIPRGVAVVADSFWTAKKARDLLVIEWDETKAEQRGTDQLMADFRALADADEAPVARKDGDVAAAFGAASRTIEHEFELPYLAHATMEPMDCVVELGEDRCDIWTGSQIQTLDQGAAAAATGLPPSSINIHTQFAGGSFGRRAVPDSDFVVEAIDIAKATEGAYPVKLIWTRENDMAAGRYRPIGIHRVRAAIDEAGRPSAWQHRIVTHSFMVGTPFESSSIVDGIDSSAVEGAANLPYTVDNIHVDLQLARVDVPVLWWRSVGHTHNGWVTEVMIDQLAHAAGEDPVAYRLGLLENHPRHRGVLELATAKADWSTPTPEGLFRGVAVHESFGSFVAQVAEVRVDDGRLKVERVVAAVDCGVAINPDVIAAQVEGAIGMGLGAFMREAVHLDDGVVREQNFHMYRPLRINEMPKVEVHIVASDEAPTGIGEPGLPPLAPAVTNAVFAATGQVITRLPLANQLSKA